MSGLCVVCVLPLDTKESISVKGPRIPARRKSSEVKSGRSAVLAGGLAALFLAATAGPARAANPFASWWLPSNHSVHGKDVDLLFVVIFWITTVTMLLVFGAMGWFLIKYRHRAHVKKGKFIHGNTRLEMVWTVTPAIILAVLAFWSKQVWSEYRFASENRPPGVKAAKVMVIGQQFKWNVIYPGPDGEFGRYLVYPKPTDDKWPDGSKFDGFAAPRDVPPERSQSVLFKYVSQSNPLGKDFDDANGKDDIWQGAMGRVMEVPLDRPVDVSVSSRDVIHSFSLPNFRLKLDTVPGMLGIVSFTPTGSDTLSSERQKRTLREYTLEEVEQLQKNPGTREFYVSIDETTQGADKDATGWRYVAPDPRNKTRKVTIIRDGQPLNYVPDDPKKDTIGRLRSIEVKKVKLMRPGYFDIVCQELCGQGHYTMQGQLVVITDEEYQKKYEGGGKAPATAPAASATPATAPVGSATAPAASVH
jgi:cytochrome c oxidase subunit 2